MCFSLVLKNNKWDFLIESKLSPGRDLAVGWCRQLPWLFTCRLVRFTPSAFSNFPSPKQSGSRSPRLTTGHSQNWLGFSVSPFFSLALRRLSLDAGWNGLVRAKPWLPLQSALVAGSSCPPSACGGISSGLFLSGFVLSGGWES